MSIYRRIGITRQVDVAIRNIRRRSMEYAVTLHLLQLRGRHELVDDPIRHGSSLSSQSQELINADLCKLSRRVLLQCVSKPVVLAAGREVQSQFARCIAARVIRRANRKYRRTPDYDIATLCVSS